MKPYKIRILLAATVFCFVVIGGWNAQAQRPTPCDGLPTAGTKSETVKVPGKIEDAYCNANCTGVGPAVPVKSGWFFPPPKDGLLKYVDRWQGQCEQKRGQNEEGTGFCKQDTVCPPGATRVNIDGVWKCKWPDTTKVVVTQTNPRDECLRNLPISISAINNPREGGAATITAGLNGRFVVTGTNVAFAERVEGNGGFTVAFADLQHQVQPSNRVSDTCAPPNCIVLDIDTTAQTPIGTRRITLFTPRGYNSASANFNVVQAQPRTGTYTSGGTPSGSTVGKSKPARPRNRVEAVASVPCPASDSRGLPIPSNPFDVVGTQVEATAIVLYLNSKEIDGKPKCTWTDPFRWFIKSLDGRNQDVVLTFNPASTNTMIQTITLGQGRWRIEPDRTFPVDYQYFVRFEQ